MVPALPEHIIFEEILSRLPVSSLARFRYVCKSWMTILSDPNFVKSRLNGNDSRNPKEDYLIRTCWGGIGILSSTTLTESHIEHVPASFNALVGSVNGLVCGVSKSRNRCILWNPILHLCKEILLPKHTPGRGKYDLIGFFWDSATEDFKLVAKEYNSSLAVVYSNKTNCWKNTDASQIPCTNEFPDVIVKGIPYWPILSDCHAILKFEAGTNRFSRLPVSGRRRYSLCNVHDCLARIEYARSRGSRGSSLDLYKLNEGCGEWSKIYTISTASAHIFPFPKCFKYSGEIVFGLYHKLCDPKLNKVKSLGYEFDVRNELHRYCYTPSLVILEGMKTSVKTSSLEGFGCTRLPRKHKPSKHSRVYNGWLSTYCGGNIQ